MGQATLAALHRQRRHGDRRQNALRGRHLNRAQALAGEARLIEKLPQPSVRGSSAGQQHARREIRDARRARAGRSACQQRRRRGEPDGQRRGVRARGGRAPPPKARSACSKLRQRSGPPPGRSEARGSSSALTRTKARAACARAAMRDRQCSPPPGPDGAREHRLMLRADDEGCARGARRPRRRWPMKDGERLVEARARASGSGRERLPPVRARRRSGARSGSPGQGPARERAETGQQPDQRPGGNAPTAASAAASGARAAHRIFRCRETRGPLCPTARASSER